MIKRASGLTCVACGNLLSGLPAIAGSSKPEGRRIPTIPWLQNPLVCCLTGLVLGAIIVWMGGLPNVIIQCLSSLSHEIGHAICGWMLGFPSIPSFDFLHGGGVTMSFAQQPWLLVLYGGVITTALWMGQVNRRGCSIIGGVAVLIAVLAYSHWSSLIILSGGHCGQLAMAAIFLFRAWTGVSVFHTMERWLYGIIGWTMLFQAVRLCWGVAYDSDIQDWYLAGKGSMDNDFVRIGDDFGMTLPGVAKFHLALCLLVPPGVWVVWRWRLLLGRMRSGLLQSRRTS